MRTLLFGAINYDSNGIGIARELELGHRPRANHMLFEASGYVATQVASLVGHTGPSFPLLLILSALFGGIALGATNLAARRTGSGRLEAIAATVWLGTTYAFWKWSTNVAYVSMAAMLVALALSQLCRKTSPRTLVITGIIGALSALAWEANIFLLPVLIVGVRLQFESWREWLRSSLYLVAAWAGTLGFIYAVLIYEWRLPDLRSIGKFMVTWGGEASPGPRWGHWGWDRIGKFAQTWIHSVIGSIAFPPAWFLAPPLRFNITLHSLALIALVILFAVPVFLFLRRWMDPMGLFFLFGIAAYLPFVIWWDPFETKWFLMPNIFLALFVARFWSQLYEMSIQTGRAVLLLAITVLTVSNVALYGMPEHTGQSEEQKAGQCVGSRLHPADLYLDPEWDFSSFMAYKYGRNRFDLVALLLQLKLNKAKMLRALEAQVRSHQAAYGDVYISDPLSRHFDLLDEWAGITSADLDGLLPGGVAFTCEGRHIRKVDLLPR